MKKLFYVVVICCLLFFSFVNEGFAAKSNSSSLEIQQTSSWEYLGDIQGVSEEFNSTYTVKLYVRIIGEKEFYQVRYNNTEGSQTSAVTFGNFFCKGKRYNAKFLVDFLGTKCSYYFNL